MILIQQSGQCCIVNAFDFNLENIYLFLFICVYVCVFMSACSHESCTLQGQKVSDSLELELCPSMVWILETALRLVTERGGSTLGFAP